MAGVPTMRCRFCDTEIAAKALICYRCGKPTSDPKVAPPPVRRGVPTSAVLGVAAAGAGIAAALPAYLDGTGLYSAWVVVGGAVAAAVVRWWAARPRG